MSQARLLGAQALPGRHEYGQSTLLLCAPSSRPCWTHCSASVGIRDSPFVCKPCFNAVFKPLALTRSVPLVTYRSTSLMHSTPFAWFSISESNLKISALPQNLWVQTRSKPSLHQQMTAFFSENIKVGSHFQFRDGFFRHELLRPMGV